MTVERKRKKKKRKESKKKKKFSIKREAHDERGRSLRKSPAIEAGIITQPLRLTTKSKADREGRGEGGGIFHETRIERNVDRCAFAARGKSSHEENAVAEKKW